MNKIIGLERKSGKFNDIEYDNTIVYYVTDCNPNVNGFKGVEVKIKTSNLCKWLGLSQNDLAVLINRKVDFHYDFSCSPPLLCGVTLLDDDKK
ncbi:MAG: hypothetical protein ACI4JM_12690 [Oscillospiraceae bacterium]